MIKDLPESSWVEFLMNFAKDHRGELVSLYAENETDGRRLIGRNQLIALEGDCVGEIVRGVKIVIGGEGDHPDNLFHFIKSPQSITIDENEDGTISEVILESGDNIKTTLVLEE
ncbi:MAG: hypothetical protein AAB360_03945 [Patescibacteria group bacterium]